MGQIREKVARLFEACGRAVYCNKFKTLAILLVVIASLSSQLPRLKVDNSTEGLLRKTDNVRKVYDAFREQFGHDELVVISISAPDVFTNEFLTQLKAFHEELEAEVPFLEDVTSLFNARNTRGEADEIIVGDLLESWPETNEEFANLRSLVLSNAFYVNNLISRDGGLATVVIKTGYRDVDGDEADLIEDFGWDDEAQEKGQAHVSLTHGEYGQVIEAVYRVMERYEKEDFSLSIAGTPVMFDTLMRAMKKDMRIFLSLSITLIFVLLSALFRRVSGVVLPMTVIVSALLCTFGLMGLFGIPFKRPTQILPSFLLAVGVADSVHILAIFYRRLQKTRDKMEAIVYSLGHSGLPVLLTSLTTAAGLLSFSFADIGAIAELGYVSAAGVMLAFVFTVLFLPALIALFPIKVIESVRANEKTGVIDRILKGFAVFSQRHAVKIVVVSVLIMAASAFTCRYLHFSHDPIAWLPDSARLKKDVAFIDEHLGGATTLEVVLDTGRENGLYEPDVLGRIDQIAKDLSDAELAGVRVGKVFSINDIVKETSQALYGNDKEHYVIPGEREEIAQTIFLFENGGAKYLEEVVDSQFSKARLTIKTPWGDAVAYEDFIDEVSARIQQVFGDSVKSTITGSVTLLARTVPATIRSAAKSYVIAFLVITIMMILLIGSIRLGLLSMLPNMLPILLVLGFMATYGIPMDIMSILIGSIAMGLVVDDTLHFMHNFRLYYDKGCNAGEAIEKTLIGTGRAMFITSTVLSLGFVILCFASMINLIRFGILTSMTIVMALLADFLLAPALMVLSHRRKN